MVQCKICSKQLPATMTVQPKRFGYYIDNQFTAIMGPTLLVYTKNGQYDAFCSEECSLSKILTLSEVKSFMENNFKIIFMKSQIEDGIIEEMQKLNSLIKQEAILTENVYKKLSEFDFAELFREQISESIKQIFENRTNYLIQHLEEAIQFSKSETEKILSIKKQVAKVLNDQGNINLLNHQAHINLCDEDIKKYKIDEMLILREQLQKAKNKIYQILS